MNDSSKITQRRSRVRVVVTYVAMFYAFFIGPLLVAAVFFSRAGDGDDSRAIMAKDIYFSILPVATSVISYWFATRSLEKTREEGKDRDNPGIVPHNGNDATEQGAKPNPPAP